ncbi:cell wall biogenesis protein [Kappamyces sp. JEL0829]|nr:cell wall biogenesis protein [Kappamyces sp. JEL0829]
MGAAESKLEFRKQVYSLGEKQDLSALSDQYWSSFYRLPETAEDVFNLCAHKEIRQALQENPEGVEILIHKVGWYGRLTTSQLVQRMKAFVDRQAQDQATTADHGEVLNCVRLLTRVLPFIFEMEAEDFETQLFWTAKNNELPLGTYIVWYLDPKLTDRSKGIGAVSAPPASKDEVLHRIEVMRLLQALLAKTMYYPAGSKKESPWALELTVKNEKKAILGMLCSFVNTIAEYDPIGWATLPYNHLLFGDITEPLVSLCCQCLIALLDFQCKSGSDPSLVKQSDSADSLRSLNSVNLPPTSSNASWTNIFAFYFSKLYKTEDFEFVLSGLCRLLKNPIDAAKAYLPGSTKKVELTSSLLLLIWVFIDSNRKFQAYLAQSSYALVILQSIIVESLEARLHHRKIGNLRMMCFLLHVLSQDRSFGIHLNTPFELASLGPHSKALPSFSGGCWGDALYLFVYVMLTTNSPARAAITQLQESYMATLANCAPLVTRFNAITAQKLYLLFSVFSSARFLLGKERNHTKLFYLLYTIDTILQYQYQGNVQIVYSFVRNKDKVLALRDLTFEAAVELASRQGKPNTDGTGLDAAATPAIETPLSPQPSNHSLVQPKSPSLSEKARGKLPASESTTSVSYESASGFRPSPSWFNEWKSRLPVQVLSTLVETLGPQVESFIIHNDLSVDTKVAAYLSAQTMVGVLPQPHPIITHSFIYSPAMHSWITAYLWGSFYMASLETPNAETAKLCPSIFGGTKVKLFGITQE